MAFLRGGARFHVSPTSLNLELLSTSSMVRVTGAYQYTSSHGARTQTQDVMHTRQATLAFSYKQVLILCVPGPF